MQTGMGGGLGEGWGVIYIVLRLPRPRTLGHQSPSVGAEPTGRPASDKYGSRWRSSRSSRGRNEWAEQTRKMSHQGECGDIKAAPRKKKKKTLSKEIYSDCLDTTHTHTQRDAKHTQKSYLLQLIPLQALVHSPAPWPSPCQTTQPPLPETTPGDFATH